MFLKIEAFSGAESGRGKGGGGGTPSNDLYGGAVSFRLYGTASK